MALARKQPSQAVTIRLIMSDTYSDTTITPRMKL